MAYLEPKECSTAGQTSQIIRHIQSLSTVRTVYSSIFNNILAYSGILMLAQPHLQARN